LLAGIKGKRPITWQGKNGARAKTRFKASKILTQRLAVREVHCIGSGPSSKPRQ